LAGVPPDKVQKRIDYDEDRKIGIETQLHAGPFSGLVHQFLVAFHGMDFVIMDT
jgi:hypothetical protein